MAGLYVLQWIGSTHEANNSFTLSGGLRPQRTVRWACWWWTPGGSQSQHLALTHEKSCTDLNHCSIVCVSISLCVSVFICVFVCVRLGALHRALALFQSAACLQPSHLKMGQADWTSTSPLSFWVWPALPTIWTQRMLLTRQPIPYVVHYSWPRSKVVHYVVNRVPFWAHQCLCLLHTLFNYSGLVLDICKQCMCDL